MRIGFLQDLTVPSHVDLVSPSFLAFDLAVHDAIEAGGSELDVEVVQMDTEGDPERAVSFAREIVADPSYVAAVAAPFWSEPPEVAAILEDAGVPTLSLSPQSPSSATGTQAASGLWRRFVPDASLQVEVLADVITSAATSEVKDGAAEPVCILGEDWSYSTELQSDLDEALAPSITRTMLTLDDDVDVDLAHGRGCGLVVWTGAPDGAVDLASALHAAGSVRGRPVDFGADALKTVIPPTAPNHEGVVVGALTCPCADVSTRSDDGVRRFINAYQSANGLAPGIYAAEAWDAAQVLAGALAGEAHDRTAVAASLARLERFDGVVGEYVFDGGGELVSPRVGLYSAAGSRWLPVDR
ncbi:MAG TPA: ABC transporter substrate-binding protein [Actinomycetota bacterium]